MCQSTETIMIPKIIHAIWLGNNEMPGDQKQFVEGWKKKMPDWEIKVWGDDDLKDFGKGIPFVDDLKRDKKYGFISDWYRLYLVYTYGGVYIDTDVEVLKSFDDLLASHFFLSYIVDSSLQIAIFGAEKGNKSVLDLLHFLESDYEKTKKVRVSNEWVTKYFLDTYPDFKLNGKEAHLSNGIDIYPMTYFDSPKSIFDFSKKGGYSIHYCAGSWMKNGDPSNKISFKQKLKAAIKKITPKFAFRQRFYRLHKKQKEKYPYYDIYLKAKGK